MPLQSSTQVATLKIIGCPKSNYNTWVTNNQVDENALYLVEESDEDQSGVEVSIDGTKLVITNQNANQGSGTGIGLTTIVVDGVEHSIDITTHKNDPQAHKTFSSIMSFTNTTDATSTTEAAVKMSGGLAVAKAIRADKVYGAVWNDYAEYRNGDTQNIKAGQVVIEKGDDSVILSYARMQPGGMIVSDTYGFVIGDPNKSLPIAVTGRVLAYTLEDRENYRNYIGKPVCVGPNGTVSLMRDKEASEYPWLIIGTVSAVPDYNEWGPDEHKVQVDGRVWIKIK